MTESEKQALEEIRELAPKAVGKMMELLENEKTSAALKVRICEIILDRTYGKPEAAVRMSVETQTPEAAWARLEAIAARIRIEVDGDG